MLMNYVKASFFSLCMLIILMSDGIAHSEHDKGANADRPTLSVSKGQRVVIDVLNLCRQSIEDCEADQIRIKTQPLEGVMFEGQSIGSWAYQHAGTSTNSDSFEVSRIKPGATEISFFVSIEVDTVNAKIEILEPTAGSSLSGGVIVVSYRTIGTGFDHLHLQLNEENHVSLYQGEGRHEFTGLKPGKYIISATLARSDHRAIPSSRRLLEVQLVD